MTRHQEILSEQDAELFRGLFESAPDAMVIVDERGKIVLVNEQTEQLFGYTQAELLGHDVELLLPTAFQHAHRMHRSGYMTHPHPRPMGVGLELYARHKDGREIPVEISLSPLKITGELLVSSAIRDVSERKQAEAELRRRARQQKVIADLGLYALQAGDLQVLMDELSRRMCEALEVDYCKILELLPEGQALLLKAGSGWREGTVGRVTMPTGTGSLAGYTLRSGEPVIAEDLSSETRFEIPPLFSEHGVRSSMTVIIHGNGQPYGVLGVDTVQRRHFSEDDIHVLQTAANLLSQAIQRKGAEEALEALNRDLEQRVEARTSALQESEERFAKAFHASPAPTFIVDLKSLRFLDVNESFLKLTEQRRDDIVQQSVYQVDLLVEAEKRKAMYSQLRRGEPLAPLEVTVRTASGGLRTVIASAQAIELGGKPCALFALIDITERKQTEEQLMQAVQAAVQDAAWFSRSIMEKLVNIRSGTSETPAITELTAREREVLALVAKGWDNGRVAEELGLAHQTVHNYLSRLYEKLNVRSRAEVIVWARQRGFVEPE